MGKWSDFGAAEKSSGDTGKVSDVNVNVKTDRGGRVSHVMVADKGKNPHTDHTHYYEKSNGSWGSHEKSSKR